MKQTEITTRVLTPEEGRFLTQADDSIPAGRRIVSTKVYLAADASPEDWREIDTAEADAIISARAAAEAETQAAIDAEALNGTAGQ